MGYAIANEQSVLILSIGIVFAADPAAPGEKIRLGERNVHGNCTGKGDTTVLLVSGIPRFSFHFAPVQTEVSEFARVCSYDKGGEAWTDPLPRLTADEFLRELDGVVEHVSNKRPVILAGHSFGGILIRAHYRLHPEKIRGLLLIDTPHPDMIGMTVNGQRKKMYELTEADMQTLAEMGRKQGMQPPPPTTIQPPFDKLPASLHEPHLWAMKKAGDASRTLDPLVALKTQADLSKHLKGQRFEVPTIVITRAKSAEQPETWVDSQQKLAATAPNGKLVRAVGSGHDIELKQPGLIVDALRELVAPARSSN